MNLVPRALTAAALALGLAGLPACGADQAPQAADPPAAQAPSGSAGPASGTLDAEDQTGDGRSVTVASVTVDAGGKGGWIALHQDLDGKPGPVKYVVAVPAGSSTDVVVPTPEGITTGAYWPMLHVDDGVIGTYEFPQTQGADLPAKADSMIVMKKINVTVR